MHICINVRVCVCVCVYIYIIEGLKETVGHLRVEEQGFYANRHESIEKRLTCLTH
jgi:hypothetical protein